MQLSASLAAVCIVIKKLSLAVHRVQDLPRTSENDVCVGIGQGVVWLICHALLLCQLFCHTFGAMKIAWQTNCTL